MRNNKYKYKCQAQTPTLFKNTKMECLCTSNSRFKIFQSLKELVANGPNPLDLLFKSCHWYNRANKKSSSPVIPINGQLTWLYSQLTIRFSSFQSGEMSSWMQHGDPRRRTRLRQRHRPIQQEMCSQMSRSKETDKNKMHLEQKHQKGRLLQKMLKISRGQMRPA